MTFTAFRTWVVGEVVTAALLNTDIRDNGNSIYRDPHLVNEIKGWPPIVAPDADLVTLGLWWDDVGTPSTKASLVDVAGEAGITETYEHALKLIAAAGSDGFAQRWTYADEPRIKSGRSFSVLLAIWSVAAVSITAKLVNSDATETAAAAVTAAAWTIVEVPNHTLAGTWCELRVTAGAAGTFYVVPLGANIGPKALILPPRPLRWVEVYTSAVVNDADPADANWVDVDLTASTSNLGVAAQVVGYYWNATSASRNLYTRRNGSSDAQNYATILCSSGTAGQPDTDAKLVYLDDGQVFEYSVGVGAAETDHVTLSVAGYYEWA